MDAHTLATLEFDAVRKKLMDEASTEPGRRSAKELMPARDAVSARWLQDETNEMRRAIAEEGRPPVDGAADLSKIAVAARIAGHPLEPEELLAIASSLRAAKSVLAWAGRIEWDKARLDAVIGNIRPEVEVERQVSAAFDEQGQVADSASPALAEVRKKAGRLEDRIRRRMEQVIAGASAWLQDTFVTLRNGRYVIPVKSGSKSNVPGIVHDASDSGATFYIEPASVVEDGNDLTAARAEERAEIRRILTALSDIVRTVLPSVEGNMTALAALDLAGARARLAEKLNAVRAEIDDAGRVALEGARHPLLIFQGIDTVPIDVRLGTDFQILVITGPNTGGKTVALKTVGLLHLMAMAGLHIPARLGARIGFFTGLWTDIGDEQSIEQSLSTFSAHLRRIIEILKSADARTLVLIDELGAGTDPAEGGALGCAILEALLAVGTRSIATTHLTDIKSFAATTPGIINGSVLFDVLTLRPLYRLEIGVPGQSNAFAIARRFGLNPGIVDRAEAFLGDRQALLERAIGDLAIARQRTETDRAAMEKARGEAEEAQARAKKKIQEAVEEKRVAMENAAREAVNLVGGARAEIERALHAVRDGKMKPQEAQRTLDKVHRDMAAKAHALERPGTPFEPGQIRVGSAVRVRSLESDGAVLEIREKRGKALVSVGGMAVEVPLDDLVRGESAPQAPAGRPSRESVPRAPLREIDLRGLRADEAVQRLGRELDQSLMAGCDSVRVIHGFGTGALAQVSREFLKKHPQVKEARMGKSDEGGGGVLVVTFKN